jgi:hypothetical protein
MNAQSIAPRMPLNVKIFLWLTLALVFYWVAANAWFWLHPASTYPAAVEKFVAHSPRLREAMNKVARSSGYIYTGTTLVWAIIFLSLAWMAAFYRLNWARWTYAFVVLFRESLPLIVALFLAPAVRGYFFYSFWHDGWTNPWHYVDPIVFIVAIVFVFTGESRNWFRRAQAM